MTKAAFPEGVIAPAHYGPRIRAAGVYLNVQQLIPEDRAAEAMADLLGATHVCPASIVAWGVKKAQDLAPVAAHVAARVAKAPVRHVDETGFRIAGKTQWLHTASTPHLTQYRVSAKRGDVAAGCTGGIIVHDHFKPYYSLADVGHALCNAHHPRELKALIEIEKEPWAAKMSRLLLRANSTVRRAAEATATALTAHRFHRLDWSYDAIVARGLAFHQAQPPLGRRQGARGRPARRPGHNLLIRLRDFKADVMRFMSDFAVPFTNNQAERDIRMMKVKMKISGGFRTQAGAETFATLRSIISTARKQAWNILQTLATPSHRLISDLSG